MDQKILYMYRGWRPNLSGGGGQIFTVQEGVVTLVAAVIEYLKGATAGWMSYDDDGIGLFFYFYEKGVPIEELQSATEFIETTIMEHQATLVVHVATGYARDYDEPVVLDEWSPGNDQIAITSDFFLNKNLSEGLRKRYMYHLETKEEVKRKVKGAMRTVTANQIMRRPIKDPRPGSMIWAEAMGNFYATGRGKVKLPDKFKTFEACMSAQYLDPEELKQTYSKDQLYFMAKGMGLPVTRQANKSELCRLITGDTLT